MAISTTDLNKAYLAYFGRPVDFNGKTNFASSSVEEVIAAFDASKESQDLYGTDLAKKVNAIYNNLFNRDAEPAGLEYWVNQIAIGEITAAGAAFSILNGAVGTDITAVENKLAAATAFTDAIDTTAEILGYSGMESASSARTWLKAVGEDEASLAAAIAGVEAAVAEAVALGDSAPSTGGGSLALTQRADNLTGTSGDDVFQAPVTQNETGSGELANTFETGDKINGGAGDDTLKAVLIATGTVQDGGGGAAIAATTTGIERVEITAQTPREDDANNTTYDATIDAGSMTGVQEWVTTQSRADVRIEDIRTRPADTTFEVESTDPRVGFDAYFNPLFMDGGDTAESVLTLTLQEITNGQVVVANELKNITVREVNFKLNGEDFTIASDDIRAANTWAELETAAAAALAASDNATLASLEISHLGNGIFEVVDASGGVFEVVQGDALILGNASDIDVRNRVEVGRTETDLPTQTTLILDGMGAGSQGGAVNIAAMSGIRGIEVFDVLVDKSSHASSLRSENNPLYNDRNDNADAYSLEQHLEVVNVKHLEGGAKGSLSIGDRTVDQMGVSTKTDDRLEDEAGSAGLLDVRVFNAAGFEGALKVGAALTADAFDKYLAGADETVQFSYLLGDGGSNLSLSVDEDLASDTDFALEVVGGEGDDRINLSDLQTKNKVSIDGAAGNNIVEVNTTTGAVAGENTAEENSWASFENVQTLVVAGTDGTVQDFVVGNMSVVENVIVATEGTADTELQQLRMDQSLTISGKNQTLGSGKSDNDQLFGAIAINGTSAVTGVDQFNVTLDNTARATAELTINELTVGNDGTVLNAIRSLNIESAGRRDVVNTIADVKAADVTTLTFTGTQDLNVAVSDIASVGTTTTPAVTISGQGMTAGDLTLTLDGVVLDNENTDKLVGTARGSDVLVLTGGINSNAVVSGFETIRFNGDANGTFNAVNTTDVTLYAVDQLGRDLTIEGLRAVETVTIDGDDADQNITLTAASRGVENTLNVTVTGDGYDSGLLAVNDFRTINLNLASDADTSVIDEFNINLVLNGYETGTDPDVLQFANYATKLNVTGGNSTSTVTDAVEFADLSLSLTHIDFSGFKGDVVGGFAAVADKTGTAYTNQADFVTNTTLTVGTYGFVWNNSEVDSADFETVTTFKFTADARNDETVWQIDGFRAFADGQSLGDLDVLDVRALGIEGLADIKVTYFVDPAAADAYITAGTAGAAVDFADPAFVEAVAVVESNDDANFTILLTGLTQSLTNENFVFTA